MIDEFRPNVIGLLCSWCSYAAADSAGRSRIAIASEFSSIRLLCTGRVEPKWVLHALLEGADGVLLCGCHIGDCHYLDGNCKAFGRVELIRTVLAQWGLEPERVRIEWVGSTEGKRFAGIVNSFVDEIKQLGPVSFDESEKDEREWP